jgi:uncharacterized membrane protein YphA (DoxX/SURF4 family)
MPPLLLIRIAIALVWFYEGLWCKLLGRVPNQESIVREVPFLGPPIARSFLMGLGVLECVLGIWTFAGNQLWWAAFVQTTLLIGMNACGLLWARRRIHDPAGMLVKNFVFVILIWVAAGLSATP